MTQCQRFMLMCALLAALTVSAAGSRQPAAVLQPASPEINLLVKEVLEDLLQRRELPDGNLLRDFTRMRFARICHERRCGWA